MTTNRNAARADGVHNKTHLCASIEHTCILDSEPVVCSTQRLERRQRVAACTGNGAVMRTVLSGAASLCAGLPDGRRQLLYLATPGEMICPYTTINTELWVEALVPTSICEIPMQVAIASSRAQPDLLLRASNQFLDATMAHLLAIGRLDGTERVTAFLVDMTRRLGSHESGRLLVHLPLNREDIADYLGLNAETVSRILGRIKRSGLVIFHSPSEFEVPDFEDLQA
ncbi:MAG: Crp/Fnr family transcriptional regulator, partial [Gammaproteobacteria bacterium]|nr:Crp/Fnr family transcriptional regulator [Gammaproteobacteria bacterium]